MSDRSTAKTTSARNDVVACVAKECHILDAQREYGRVFQKYNTIGTYFTNSLGVCLEVRFVGVVVVIEVV